MALRAIRRSGSSRHGPGLSGRWCDISSLRTGASFPNRPEALREPAGGIKRDAVFPQLPGDEDFDQLKKADRLALGHSCNTITVEDRPRNRIGNAPPEPFSDPGPLQAGEVGGLAEVVDAMTQDFHRCPHFIDEQTPRYSLPQAEPGQVAAEKTWLATELEAPTAAAL